MRKKSILMLSNDFLPNIGGVAAHIYEISKQLTIMGHNVVVLTKYYSLTNKVKYEKMDGFQVIRVPITKIKKYQDLQYVVKMRKIINRMIIEKQLDIIHWHTLNKDSLVMKKIDFKEGVVLHTNHFVWFREMYRAGQFNKLKQMIPHTDYFIAPSYETEKMTKEVFGQNKVVMISNGVDDKKFYPDESKKKSFFEKYGINKTDCLIVTTNRMSQEKGMEYVIKAIPEIVNKYEKVVFAMAGDGPLLNKFQKFIENNLDEHFRKRVFFLGRVENKDIPEIVNAADIFLQTSLEEGCSISLIEAMSCAKPIIATNIGGNPDIVEDGLNGFLIESGSTQAVINGLEKLIENKSERAVFGFQGKKRVKEQLNWERISEQVENAYQQAFEQKFGLSSE